MQFQEDPNKKNIVLDLNNPSFHGHQNISEKNGESDNKSKVEDILHEIYEKITAKRIKEGFVLYDKVLSTWKMKLQEKPTIDYFISSFSHINFIGLDFLLQKDFEMCRKILWKLEEILRNDIYQHFIDLKILLFNNIGCYYKFNEKSFESLMYLQKAMSFMSNETVKRYKGYTYLNMSILQSQQNHHEEAVKLGKIAVIESEKEFGELNQNLNLEEKKENKDFQHSLNTTLNAYEHLAREEEIAKNYRNSCECHEKAYKFVQENYGTASKLAKIFLKNLEDFKERYKILFKSTTLPKKKKRRKIMKKPGLTLEMNKLKPYFEAYNLTPKDLYFSGKNWNFKSNSKKFIESNFLTGKSTYLNPLDPSKKLYNPLFNNYNTPPQDTNKLINLTSPSNSSTRFFHSKFTSTNNLNNNSKILHKSYNSFQNPNLIKIEENPKLLTNIHGKPEVKNNENDTLLSDSIDENNREILDYEDEESIGKNRNNFLINLKSYEASNENPFDINNKNKPNEPLNIKISRKKNSLTTNKNENNNPVKNTKNLFVKTIEIKSAYSSSPVSNSFIKSTMLTNNNNNNNSSITPKKSKILITTKKLSRPSFMTKTPQNNSNKEKIIKLIQKNIRNWMKNRKWSRYYKILFHSPSYEIKFLEKSPIKKSRNLDNSTFERTGKGCLLMIYYKKRNEVRVVFKMLTLKKLYYHFFDLSPMGKIEEALKMKIINEFFKEIMKSFCIFYDDLLMLKEFINTKNTTISFKLMKFVFKELILEKKDENSTSVSMNKQKDLLENQYLLSTEIEASLDIDPLFGNNLHNISFERIEPLLFSMPASDLNMNQIPSPIMKSHDMDGEGLEPMLITIKPELMKQDSLLKNEEEKVILSTLTIDRFQNIRIYSSSPRFDNNAENEKNKDLGLNNDGNSKLDEKSKKKEMLDAVKKLQCFWRKTLAQERIITMKNKGIDIRVSLIKKNGDLVVWLKIIFDLKKKNYYIHATFIDRFKKKVSDFVGIAKIDGIKKSKNTVFKIDIPKELAAKILISQRPFVWFQINPKLKMISIRNMQIYERIVSKFEKMLNSKFKQLKMLFFHGLTFRKNSGQMLKKMHVNVSKLVDHHHKILKNHTFHQILMFANKRKKDLKFYDNITKIINTKKNVYAKILMVRLKLNAFKENQINGFSNRVDKAINSARTRIRYKQAIKVLYENSRFKDYLPICKRNLLDKNRMICAYIYFNPSKLELLIISEDSDILEYQEFLKTDTDLIQLTEYYQKDLKKEPQNLKKYLIDFTLNLTLIFENSKSLMKRFKIYSQKCLDSALSIQKFILKRLYYRVFEIHDKEYDYRCRVYVKRKQEDENSLILLLLKTLPSFVNKRCEFPDKCLNYLQISDKMNHLENFIEKYVSFNERTKEFLFIPPSNNKWILKKKKEIFIQNNEKNTFELGAEIDYLNNKISIRVLKVEINPYKMSIPESYSLAKKKEFINEALNSCVVYKDDEKLRMISDNDPYGPLSQKTPFTEIDGKLLEGNFRIIESKKCVILLIEFFQTKTRSTVTSSQFPFVSEDQKFKIIAKLKANALGSLSYNLELGIFLDDVFYNECLSVCNGVIDQPRNVLILSKEKHEHDGKNSIDSKEIEPKTTETKSFSRNKSPHTNKKAPTRSYLTKENRPRSSKIVTKKLKESVFEKEALPSEDRSSPKIPSKKDLTFSSRLDTKTADNVHSVDIEGKNKEGNDNKSETNSPKSKSSLNSSVIKPDLLSPEVKEFNTTSTSQQKHIKKGLSLKNMTGMSPFETEINNNKLNETNKANEKLDNLIEKAKIVPEKQKLLKLFEEKAMAILVIQKYVKRRIEKKREENKKIMLNPDLIEISKNPLNFPNPRRPCDYRIVICKDPLDVLNAIIFIQAWTRNILAFKKRMQKNNSESLNEAHISVNCEESNLDSIKSVSFLDQVLNDDGYAENDFVKPGSFNKETSLASNNNKCYEKEDDECLK